MRPSWLACPTRTKPSTLTKRRQWRLRGQDSTRCFCASRSALINESMILLEDHKCVQGHMQGQESRELFALPQKLADASRCVCCFRVLSSRQCMITKLFGPVLQLARLAGCLQLVRLLVSINAVNALQPASGDSWCPQDSQSQDW